VNEGFFVTGILYPLILPPDLPLWMAALGISFGVVIAKEVFGGTGMNFINPALAARAFVFFAYPAEMSGDDVWVAAPVEATVDGWTAATPLAEMRLATGRSRPRGFPGGTRFWASSRQHGRDLGAGMPHRCRDHHRHRRGLLADHGGGRGRHHRHVQPLQPRGLGDQPLVRVPFWWHMVLGSWAFATVFMVTDPVTSPFTDAGKWVYGIIIGAMIVLIRVVNPAYPESVMLVILFMNVMAPMIDHVFVRGNIKRRLARRG
jgi:Na+-transporting NADH:ubiquinone oxidoreductase subunit B